MASVNKYSGKGRDKRDRAHIMVNSEEISAGKICPHKIFKLLSKFENCFGQDVSRDRRDVFVDFLHCRSGALRVRAYNAPLFRFLHDLKIGCTDF